MLSKSPIPQSTTEPILEQVVTQSAEVGHQEWKHIPLEGLAPAAQKAAIRLNGFGSLFYFTKAILRKHRLTNKFHREICEDLEKDYIKDVEEIPRDHFKTTICSEAAPIWWGLPFNENDANMMRALGYSEEYITWMHRAHNQNSRTLIASEVITNATKIGYRIDTHYLSNDLFRAVYPEIIPDSSCIWNATTKAHKRTSGKSKYFSANGEGTFDFIGVGGALQSRHYDRLVQDDLVGKKAAKGTLNLDPVVMKDTIEWHQLLVGAFDGDPARAGKDNDEIVVGNRWAYNDLNSWIKENEPYFNFHTHSALGGCCEKHPANTPIFPEEFTAEKLERYRKRLGTYFFSCQFLNSPIPPGNNYFKEEYLRWYEVEYVPTNDLYKKRVSIKHEVKKGEVIKDILPGNMQREILIDPNHAGQEGRCRHAVVVLGIVQQPVFRVYILKVFAESCGYEELCRKAFELAEFWKVKRIWLETVAAQKYLKFHLEYVARTTGKQLEIKDLKTERSRNGKQQRIEQLLPYLEAGQIWVPRIGAQEFLDEYYKYPHSATVDILDILGYFPQVIGHRASDTDIYNFVAAQKYNFEQQQDRDRVTGY